MYVLFAGVAIFAAWRWGDWRHWEKYHATILFMIVGDLLYRVLTTNYSLWDYNPAFFPNGTIAQLFIAFTVYPSTVILFLSCMPVQRKHQIRHYLSWVIVYSLCEWLAHSQGLLSYYNGWSLSWSIFFNFIMFAVIWIHHKRPLLAYFLSTIVIVTLMMIFQVPINAMK